ncbi:hypothetical protein Tco_0542444 [Tanacetum coccineum]
MDEPEPQHTYDFFAPGPLPGYAGNPNNMNGWIEADVPLLVELGEMGKPLGVEVGEPLVDPVIDELDEPIVEVGEQMVAPVMDMEEDLAMLFVDDDFSDDGLDDDKDDEEVWEMDEEWLIAPVTPPPMPVMPPPSTYEVGGSSSASAEGHSLTLLAPGVPVPPSVVKDFVPAWVIWSMVIREISPRVSTMEGQMQVMESQMVQVKTLQAAVQHRDVQIQQLQTLVAEMSSREATLMQCILGLDRRLADVERRYSGPQ